MCREAHIFLPYLLSFAFLFTSRLSLFFTCSHLLSYTPGCSFLSVVNHPQLAFPQNERWFFLYQSLSFFGTRDRGGKELAPNLFFRGYLMMLHSSFLWLIANPISLGLSQNSSSIQLTLRLIKGCFSASRWYLMEEEIKLGESTFTYPELKLYYTVWTVSNCYWGSLAVNTAMLCWHMFLMVQELWEYILNQSSSSFLIKISMGKPIEIETLRIHYWN